MNAYEEMKRQARLAQIAEQAQASPAELARMQQRGLLGAGLGGLGQSPGYREAYLHTFTAQKPKPKASRIDDPDAIDVEFAEVDETLLLEHDK